jgi:microcystin-dependent protein
MAANPGVIVAYGAATAPTGWLLCDGSAVSQATYAALYAAIGTDFGPDTGGNFTLPDYRGRFALGKSATGTGSTVGETGGALDHTHTGPSHTHAVDQPADHTAHTVTQPSSHGTLTHTGAAIANHSLMSHTGAVVAAHSITEASAHSDHASGGAHTHDGHVSGTRNPSANPGFFTAPTGAHSSDGGHTHDAHSAHTGTTIDSGAAHSVTQAADHSADTHTISAQATSHGTLTHSGMTVTGAHSHTGMATQAGGTAASGGANPPFQVVTFIIAVGTTEIPVGAISDFGGTSAPTGHIICDGSSYNTTTDADLFAVIGYNFGGSGANFNVPDLRDRHPLGKAAAGTGSTIGATGGAVNHVHAGPSHTHTVTQADAHGSHTIGQASSHGTLTHTGTTVSDHAALSHSGLALGNHTVGQPATHSTHATNATHTHNSHTNVSKYGNGTDNAGWMHSPTTHSGDGAHTHDAHPAHTGQALDAHSVTAQNSNHAAQSHSLLITEASSHGTLNHTGADLDAHSAHSGGATSAGGTGNTSAGEAPYLTVNFIIKAHEEPTPIGSGFMLGSMAVPSLALACDGASYLRVDYPYLFAVIGTAFGAADSDHFNVPDMRGRIPRGKSASTALNDSGGARDHTHTGPLHSHGVTQPSAHSDHTPTQPTSHGTLTHSGFALSDHAALSHSGLTIANHTPTQAGLHGTHSTDGAHTHDAHTAQNKMDAGSTNYLKASTHSSDGGHTHDAHSAHTGFAVNAHSITSAGSDHAARSHTVSAQPDSHGTLTHSGFAVDAHSAHSGFATYDDGNGTMGAANPAYITVNYAIWAIGFDRSGTSSGTGGGVVTITQTTSREPSETFTGGGVASITQTTDRQPSEDMTGGGVLGYTGAKGGTGTVHLSDGGGTGISGTTTFGWAA